MKIDTALLSKIERGDRNLKRELLIRWLSEKINDLLTDEPLALEALNGSLKNLKNK